MRCSIPARGDSGRDVEKTFVGVEPARIEAAPQPALGVGELPGDPGARIRLGVLRRLEVLAGAQAELAKLPPDVRSQASLQAWTAKAEARGKAVEAARKLAADAVTALKASP